MTRIQWKLRRHPTLYGCLFGFIVASIVAGVLHYVGVESMTAGAIATLCGLGTAGVVADKAGRK